METTKKENLLSGLLFAMLMSALLGILFFSYLPGSGDISFMDFGGWVYYLLSSLMHASFFILPIFLVVYLPLALLGVPRKVNAPLLCTLYTLVVLAAVINRYVFQIYHFHINGFVLDMLFSEGAGDIFVFSFWLYVKVALILLGVIAVVVLLYRLALRLTDRIGRRRRFCLRSGASLLAIVLLSQGMHIYGAATLNTSILESNAFLPYYFPLSINSLLDKMGIIDKKNITTLKIQDNEAPITYPLKPIESDSLAPHPNIVVIAIDSWNFTTLTEECMPHLWSLKEESEFFCRHLSSSNGTRGGIFGLFTGLSSYYWKSFEYSSLKPLLVEQLVADGYDLQLYPSATFQSPPFDRMFFKGMEGLNFSTQGETAYDKDCNLTANFLGDLPRHKDGSRPFFAFLFYDLGHAITLPKEKNTHFLPAWDFADYSRLHNSMDPTPYFNLYRNCIYQIDSLIGIVVDNLKAGGYLDNTILIVTGDHGQEFNENKKNYWGHAGNYTCYQIQVPLIVHRPQGGHRTYTHRTTHYDIVPTLMKRAFGVSNSPEDYSMGTDLYDTASRGWHIVGNDLNYAFITEDHHIIEKQGNGRVKVYDKGLNIQKDYKIPPQEINNNLFKLTRFVKK